MEKKKRTFPDQIANRQQDQDGYSCQQKGHKTKCKKDRSRWICRIFFTFCNHWEKKYIYRTVYFALHFIAL